MTTYYKVTGPNGQSYHGGSGVWVPGEWREVEGPLRPCYNGLHLCRRDELVYWLGPRIWTAEVEGEVIEEPDKVVSRKARVLAPYETWNERTARLFAADCAEHVLPIYEAKYPGDDRPRKAIEVARRYANGEASKEELGRARRAARLADAAAAYAAAAAAYDDAAEAAAGASTLAADRQAERAWQTERLFDYLEGRA